LWLLLRLLACADDEIADVMVASFNAVHDPTDGLQELFSCRLLLPACAEGSSNRRHNLYPIEQLAFIVFINAGLQIAAKQWPHRLLEQ
jgi:hypothetical protein